jgi:hypothetical protein
MNQRTSRLRVVAVLGALGAVGATAITVMSCEPDHNRDVPGPPKIISAYVNDLKFPPSTASDQINGGMCDGTDPRFFGGGFVVHDQTDPTKAYNVRCIPDLLAQMPDNTTGCVGGAAGPGCGDTGPFSYAVQVRAVFSEGLDGDKIEMQDNVKLISQLHDNVISVQSVMPASPVPVPINTGPLTSGEYTSYYDPAGADFKQGIYGTAPPGPSIVVTPGQNNADGTPALFGLPSGSATQICFDPTQVTDTAGNHLTSDSGANCITVHTLPLDVTSQPGDSMGSCASGGCDMVTSDDLMGNGITLTFTAPIADSDIAVSGYPWLVITVAPNGGAAVTLPNTCYSIDMTTLGDPTDATLPSADTLVVPITVDTTCPVIMSAALPATVTVTVKAGSTIKDQYGVPLQSDVTHEFQIVGATTDGGT